MATDLNKDSNLIQRVIQTIRDESKAVTISGIALICGVLAVLLSIMASNNATEARIRVEFQEERFTEMRESVDYWTAHAQALRAELKARGFEFDDKPSEAKIALDEVRKVAADQRYEKELARLKAANWNPAEIALVNGRQRLAEHDSDPATIKARQEFRRLELLHGFREPTAAEIELARLDLLAERGEVVEFWEIGN